ncbi:patatin-like phospholipase family protein [Mycobacterium sp.]|uniref:patatin-like phospholipase family protein n=1 Tax=Mycobacterium sp. TaxID=1785 RepID=UPI002C546BE0|nr:patatin-like phospholipase family protein [Mycobacterium sp.]HME49307.1 patatin-like phospholipase family protein [Mycobacterium sp.]
MSLALVLAGGGVAGIAWETGFLLGVQDESPETASRLRRADVLLGTSAGSTVAAQLGSGVGLAELYARQLSETTHEIGPHIDFGELMTLFERAAADSSASVTRRLRLIGELAVSAPTVALQVRRAVIAKRLPSHDWPDRPLRITAIDVKTGERVIFDRNSGVELIDAVAASCAVPAVWPPVTIGGRQFMDGGVGSSANVDAVADHETVVMLAPTAEPGLSPFGRSLADELEQHRTGPALGIFADDASIAAFGRDPLDPRCRAPSAIAGRDQGRREAAGLAAFLAASAQVAAAEGEQPEAD